MTHASDALQQTAAALEEASQNSDSHRRACADISAGLVQKVVSGHQDKVSPGDSAPLGQRAGLLWSAEMPWRVTTMPNSCNI